MTQLPVSSSSEQSIFAALELSKNSWLLAIQLPERDNPSLHRIKGLQFGQGIRGINVISGSKNLKPAELVTGDGRPLPERLGR